MTTFVTSSFVDHLAMPLGGLGPTEWWIIGAVVLLFFGGRKLPALARSMGSSITEFKAGLKDGDDKGTPEIDSSSKDD